MEQSSSFQEPGWDDNGYPNEEEDEMMDLSPTNSGGANHVDREGGDEEGEHHDQLPSVEEVRANMYLDNPNDANWLSPSSLPSNRKDDRARNGRTFPFKGVAIVATVLQ